MTKKRKGGRPTDYDPENYPRMAYVACMDGGFTDVKLAKLFGVSKATINNWKKEHPEFFDSIVRGKDEFDCAAAENCLLKRVKGFRYTEITREPSSKEPDKMVVTKKVSKMVVPDTKAIQFFLINRSRRDPQTGEKRWNQISQTLIKGSLDIYQKLTDEQLEAKLTDLCRKAGIDAPAEGIRSAE